MGDCSLCCPIIPTTAVAYPSQTNSTSCQRNIMPLYFAYGSNLWRPRLEARVGDARVVGVATAVDYALKWHKMSQDGSGKCDIIPAAGNTVFGVVYWIDEARLAALDHAEGTGYERVVAFAVVLKNEPLHVIVYRAQKEYIQPALLPFDWYHALVVAGAKRHGLSDDYMMSLEAQAFQVDTNAKRATRERSQLSVAW